MSKGFGTRCLYGLLCLLFLAACFVFTGCEDNKTKALEPSRIAEYNKPATLMVYTDWKAQIGVPEWAINEQALSVIALAKYKQAGVQPRSAQELLVTMLDEFFKNPLQYLTPTGNQINKQVQLDGMGTGFIITHDGYIITNAHVVKMLEAELKHDIAIKGLNELVNTDLAKAEHELGQKLPAQYAANFTDAIAMFYAHYMTMGQPITETFVLLNGSWAPAQVINVGEPSPGKDVAILKINAANLPTVMLGDDRVVRDGETAIALGYPGVATFNPLLANDISNMRPSLTIGSISARKTMPGGWEVLQTDTSITHGNSGGPLFNGRGEVIAINTFGSGQLNDKGMWVETQGFNFAIPTTVVREFLSASGINPVESPLAKSFREGVDYYFDEHYNAAKEKFNYIVSMNPSYPYAQSYLANCNAFINDGRDKPVTNFLLIGGIAGGALLLILLIIIFLVILPASRRKKKAKTASGVPSASGKNCPSCGHLLDGDAVFCDNCGQKLS